MKRETKKKLLLPVFHFPLRQFARVSNSHFSAPLFLVNSTLPEDLIRAWQNYDTFLPFMLDGGSNKDYKLSSLLPGSASIRSGNYVHVWKHFIAMMLSRHFNNEVTTSCYLSRRKDENDPKFLFADDKKLSQSSKMPFKCFRRLFNVSVNADIIFLQSTLSPVKKFSFYCFSCAFNPSIPL